MPDLTHQGAGETAGRRRRRFRFGMRSLLAMPIAIGLGLFLADRVWVTPWTQWGTELVEFRVVDANSGRPIPGAEIALTGGTVPVDELPRSLPEVSSTPIVRGGSVHRWFAPGSWNSSFKASTDDQGTYAFAIPYRFAGRTSLLRETRDEEIPWRIEVSAADHEAASSRMADHRFGSGRRGAGLPSPVVIRLEPKAKPAP